MSNKWVQLVLYECDAINQMLVFTHTTYESKMRSDLYRLPVSRTGINLMATQTLERIYNAYIALC
jgi:hypothetical protein